MKPIARLTLVLIILVIAIPALAANPEPQLPKSTPENSIPAPGVPVAKDTDNPAKVQDELGTTSPMMSEINVAMDITRGAIAELAASAAGTHDFAAQQAIQTQISTLKKQTELDILAIQARYARSAGNVELATQIDAAIEAITSPPAPVAPAEERPVPVNHN